MAQFIIAYHGGRSPETPEAGKAHFAKWQAWISGLGDKVINPGTPLGMSKMVSSTGVSDPDMATKLSGYCVVEAADMDEAIEIAKGDPFLAMGDVEVAPIMSMGG